MVYDPKRGDALLIPSGPQNDPDRKHLHGIVTDRCGAEMHLLVCVESVGGGYYDDTCLLEPGDHPFIKKQSWVNYARTRHYKANFLTKLVDGWVYYKQKDDLSDDLLKRICAGITVSRQIPRGMKKYFEAQQPE